MAGSTPVAALRGAAAHTAATLIDMVGTRLELASVELEEERLRLAGLALAFSCVLVFGVAALAAGVIALVLWCPPDARPLVMALAAAASAGVAALSAWRWRHLHATRPPLLQATLAELHADAAALRGDPP